MKRENEVDPVPDKARTCGFWVQIAGDCAKAAIFFFPAKFVKKWLKQIFFIRSIISMNTRKGLTRVHDTYATCTA